MIFHYQLSSNLEFPSTERWLQILNHFMIALKMRKITWWKIYIINLLYDMNEYQIAPIKNHVYHSKEFPSIFAFILKNWMPRDIYGNTKAWKRKKKKKRQSSLSGVPGSSAERFEVNEQMAKTRTHSVLVSSPQDSGTWSPEVTYKMEGQEEWA